MRRVLNASVQSCAALDAVPAGELVDAEQVAVVEHQALRVLVRQLADAHLIRPDNKLGDWFDRLRAPGMHADERVAIFEADRRHEAAGGAFPRREVVADASLALD